MIAGDRTDASWTAPSKKSDFFFGKGVVTTVLERLGIEGASEKGLTNDLYSEGITLSKGKKTLVEYGVVNKNVTKYFDIETQVLFADFNWDAILAEIPTDDIILKPIPKFPKVKRDFALLLDESVTFDKLRTAALQTEKQLLKQVSLFDVYTGKKLPKGKKSYALSFTLQDVRKTLTDKQIDKIMSKLQQRFEKRLWRRTALVHSNVKILD